MSRAGEGAPVAAPPVALRARVGAPPLGAIFGGIGALAAAAVWALGLDRVPLTLCLFKAMTGLPCPTCGGTRALGRLAAGDVAGAVAMNPLAAAGAAVLAAWALADLLLLPSGRAVALEVSGRASRALRVAVPAALLLNWLYLVAAGR